MDNATAERLIAALDACRAALTQDTPTPDAGLVDKVGQVIAERGAVSHRDLQRGLGGRVRSGDLRAVTGALALTGAVQVSTTMPAAGGRRTVTYHAATQPGAA